MAQLRDRRGRYVRTFDYAQARATAAGVTRSLAEQAAAALYRQAEAVMTRSKEEFVPVDLSPLKNSGHVLPPEIVGRKIRVRLVYGGPAAPYALVVHEHLSRFSPPSWRGTTVHFTVGGPKYLERPLLEAVPGMAGKIAREVRIGRGPIGGR